MKLKKFVAFLLATMMLLTCITACGNNEPDESDIDSSVSAGTTDDTASGSTDGTTSGSTDGTTSGSADGTTSGSADGTTNGAGGKTTNKTTGKTTNKTTNKTTASNVDNTINNDDAFSNKKKVFKEQVTNLNGATIKIASLWNEWEQTSNCPPGQIAAVKGLREIEKAYNCKIEMVRVDPAKMNQEIAIAYSAGRVYADIVETQLDPAPLVPYMSDLSKVSTVGLTTNDWEPFMTMSATYQGVPYGVGFMMNNNTAISQRIIVFNKTLAQKYGVGDLYKLVKEGKWDYNAFEAATKTVYQKTNGKTVGLIQQFGYAINEMIYTNNVTLVDKDSQGYYFKHNDANTLTALNFWSDYAKKGYINDHISSDYGASAAKLFMQRKSLFFITEYIGLSTWLNASMEDAYGLLPLPKGPNASDYTTVASCKYFMLTKDNPQIDAAGRILVAIANRTQVDMDEYDIGQLETALRDEESLEMLRKINSSSYFNPNATRGLNENLLNQSIFSIIHEQKSAAQLLQEIKGNQNAALASYYK